MIRISGFFNEQKFIEIEIFYNIWNVFTDTFDQFNASLMNKYINFFPKLLLTSNFWTVV